MRKSYKEAFIVEGYYVRGGKYERFLKKRVKELMKFNFKYLFLNLKYSLTVTFPHKKYAVNKP